MFKLFRKNTRKSEMVKMTPIKRFDSKEEYLNMINELILDTKVDSDNWSKSSFITSLGGSLTFSKGRVSSISPIGKIKSDKESVEIRVEFRFNSSDDFMCDKIELKIANYNRLTIEDCNTTISNTSLRILYDFYCQEQIIENNKESHNFNKDKEVIDSIVSKSTKRDNKLNSLLNGN